MGGVKVDAPGAGPYACPYGKNQSPDHDPRPVARPGVLRMSAAGLAALAYLEGDLRRAEARARAAGRVLSGARRLGLEVAPKVAALCAARNLAALALRDVVREQRATLGMCTRCGSRPSAPGGLMLCPDCRDDMADL